MTSIWSGDWVADRLDARLVTYPSSNHFLRLQDLVGLALRQNSRRAHLLVSTVLGKHIPVDPRIVYGAGWLLGARVADLLSGTDTGIVEVGSDLLLQALTGDDNAAAALSNLCDRPLAPTPAVVLGFAETATGLGHVVADALVAPYLHSTRRSVSKIAPIAGFEEEHSHASSHLLLPEDPAMLAGAAPLVLVDDELSTGRTALNTIRALHRLSPGSRSHYVVAALVGVRSAADRAQLDAFAADLGIRIDVVCLVAGEVELPADVLDRGASLVAEHETPTTTNTAVPRSYSTMEIPGDLWPATVRDGGRHGIEPEYRQAFEAAATACAAQLAEILEEQRQHSGSSTSPRILVLGFEELMYAPLRIAIHLHEAVAGWATVHYSTTTRSPILPVDDESYAVRTRLTFASLDDAADDAPRYAYNVAPGEGKGPGFTDIIMIVDSEARQSGSLRDQLAGVCDRLIILTLPSYRPAYRSDSTTGAS